VYAGEGVTSNVESAGREILGNIPASQQALFYLLAWLSLAVFSFGIAMRARLWLRGRARPLLPGGKPGTRLLSFITGTLAQRRVRATATGHAHIAIFWGFLVLFVGTNLVLLEHETPLSFLHGLFYLLFSLVLDLFGLLMLAGVWVAARRRYHAREVSDRVRGYGPALTILALLGLGGFALEGLRMALLGSLWFDFSPVGAIIARGLALLQPDQATLGAWHLYAWWLHALVAFGFIAYLPFGRLLHAITIPLHILVTEPKPGGMLSTPFLLDEIESGDRTRATPCVAADLHWTQLLALDACTECGLCDDACPALAVGRPLSPRRTVVELRQVLDQGAHALDKSPLADAVSPADAWSCTTCGACADVCPASIRPAELLVDVRRALVLNNRVATGADTTLTNLLETGNPFGFDPGKRMAWAADLAADSKPVILSTEQGAEANCELLLWVGCWGAFDERSQKVTRSLATLLARAGVDYAVLGTEERCTGDPARRLGEEGLFQQLATANIDTLQHHGIKKIVSACPHCVNSLGNEYRDFGADFEVLHHSQYIDQLVADGRLDWQPGNVDNSERTVTFHDPCYLGRLNHVYDPPRRLLSALPATNTTEMAATRQTSQCCGAGGANAWFDIGVGGRMNAARYEQAAATGAQSVATGCPFCLAMLEEAASATGETDGPSVEDLAELVEASTVRGKNSGSGQA